MRANARSGGKGAVEVEEECQPGREPEAEGRVSECHEAGLVTNARRSLPQVRGLIEASNNLETYQILAPDLADRGVTEMK